MVKQPLPQTRFSAFRARLEAFEPQGRIGAGVYEVLLFGFKQGWACLFGALLLALLLLTHWLYPVDARLPRYDFLTISAVLIQIGMLAFRLENWTEAKVILVFHVVGTVMELFKTAVGSWAYPEAAYLRLWGVPLFSGFMYAAVGSYIARIWRIFDFEIVSAPSFAVAALVGLGIYLNFFSHHYIFDFRWVLFAALALLFWRTRVTFTIWRTPRWMPMLLGWFLVAAFIWIAENASTFANAWVYPNQQLSWSMVSPTKLGAWYLLMYISFMLVASVNTQSWVRMRSGKTSHVGENVYSEG
ncbi:MAG: DUF817 domain-containing protein [Pseudomonadota bacterium]